MCFQHNFFQGRSEFIQTYEELWEVAQGTALWAKTSARLRGVQVENSTPPSVSRKTDPPAGGILMCMFPEIIKVSPASMFIAFQTIES